MSASATRVATTPLGWLAFSWGLLGVVALLSQAMFRLGPLAWEAVEGGLSTVQWVVLVVPKPGASAGGAQQAMES